MPRLLLSAIKECEKKFGKTVIAVCTGDGNKMVEMRQMLKDARPGLLAYGCSSHYADLLENEVTPRTPLKYIVEAQKYFRNHHQAHRWFKEKGGLMPQLPNATRKIVSTHLSKITTNALKLCLKKLKSQAILKRYWKISLFREKQSNFWNS